MSTRPQLEQQASDLSSGARTFPALLESQTSQVPSGGAASEANTPAVSTRSSIRDTPRSSEHTANRSALWPDLFGINGLFTHGTGTSAPPDIDAQWEWSGGFYVADQREFSVKIRPRLIGPHRRPDGVVPLPHPRCRGCLPVIDDNRMLVPMAGPLASLVPPAMLPYVATPSVSGMEMMPLDQSWNSLIGRNSPSARSNSHTGAAYSSEAH